MTWLYPFLCKMIVTSKRFEENVGGTGPGPGRCSVWKECAGNVWGCDGEKAVAGGLEYGCWFEGENVCWVANWGDTPSGLIWLNWSKCGWFIVETSSPPIEEATSQRYVYERSFSTDFTDYDTEFLNSILAQGRDVYTYKTMGVNGSPSSKKMYCTNGQWCGRVLPHALVLDMSHWWNKNKKRGKL